MQVPKDLIEPIIQAHVQKAVLDAIGNKTEILERAIGQVLNAKVDREGRYSTYNSNNDVTWLQYIVQDCIKKAAVSAIQEAMEKHQTVFRESIIRQLRDKKSKLADQLIEAMCGAFNHEQLKYRLSISYKPE